MKKFTSDQDFSLKNRLKLSSIDIYVILDQIKKVINDDAWAIKTLDYTFYAFKNYHHGLRHLDVIIFLEFRTRIFGFANQKKNNWLYTTQTAVD